MKNRRIAIRLTDMEYATLMLTIVDARFRNITDAVRFALTQTILKPTASESSKTAK